MKNRIIKLLLCCLSAAFLTAAALALEDVDAVAYAGTRVSNAALALNVEGETPDHGTGEAEPADVAEIPFRTVSFAFADSPDAFSVSRSYRIPEERYQLVFGSDALARHLYETDGASWGGNCFGMASASALFFGKEGGLDAGDFRENAETVAELRPDDVSAQMRLTLREWIEALQIIRKSPEVCKALRENRGDLDGLCAGAATFQDTQNNPLIVCVGAAQSDEERFLTVWKSETVSDTEIRLYVYDPEFPLDDGRYLTVSKAGDGRLTDWAYALDGRGTVGGDSGGNISYLPCSVCGEVWKNRGNPSKENVLLTANRTDLTVSDVITQRVLSFRGGVPETERDDIWPLPNQAGGVSVWLPTNDVYTVRNDASGAFTASLVNVRQAVAVTTDAREVSLSAEDVTVSAYALLMEEDREYRIAVRSGLGADMADIVLSGKTVASAPLSVSCRNGILSLSGVSDDARFTINGEAAPKNRYQIPGVDTNPLFSDVQEDSYYYDAVKWAVQEGITKGTSADKFSPNNFCTRSHIITFLWRANGSPEPGITQNPFSDVPSGCYYEKAAIWAYDRGLETGKTFRGGTRCTRAAAVVYLWELEDRPAGSGHPFADVPRNAVLSRAVAWAVQQGITYGTSENTFSPDNVCTRGQIVAFLYRHYGRGDDAVQ